MIETHIINWFFGVLACMIGWPRTNQKQDDFILWIGLSRRMEAWCEVDEAWSRRINGVFFVRRYGERGGSSGGKKAFLLRVPFLAGM